MASVCPLKGPALLPLATNHKGQRSPGPGTTARYCRALVPSVIDPPETGTLTCKQLVEPTRSRQCPRKDSPRLFRHIGIKLFVSSYSLIRLSFRVIHEPIFSFQTRILGRRSVFQSPPRVRRPTARPSAAGQGRTKTPEQPMVTLLVDVPVLPTVGVGAICAQSSPQCSGWVPRRLCAATASLAQPLTLLSF